MTNDLKAKDYGGYVNHYGIYSFVEKCTIQKYIYLVININIAKNKDFYTDSAFVKVIFKYHKPENIFFLIASKNLIPLIKKLLWLNLMKQKHKLMQLLMMK